MSTADVLVLGAGVSGLTTAICLAEAGATVRVWAAEPPQRTTSAVAGALWGPAFGAPQDEWTYVTQAEFDKLASDPRTGVHQCRGREVSDISSEPPPWLDRLPQVELCDPATLPHDMLIGLWTTVPVVDMPRYLGYLEGRLAASGVAVRIHRVASLAAAAAAAPMVINCTGIGAAELTGDRALAAVRGQHVIVRNPGIEHFYIEARAEATGVGFVPAGSADDTRPPDSMWAGFFPHGDHVVLGGVAQPGNFSLAPDLALAERIVAVCAEVEPRLADAPVLGHQVGLRPGRPTVRLEAEQVDGATVVHNYGHGGMGVSLSWGCARAVQELLA